MTLVAVLIAGSSVASAPALAAETDEYPWANAQLLNLATYDWGYAECQQAMLQARVCSQQVFLKDGINYYQSDPWGYYVRNCTSYVAWRVSQELGINIDGWGNAHSWDTAAQAAGYPVDTNPQTGDIAVWEGYYGHVAIVTAVNPDRSVNVAQYNRAGTGEFSRESRVTAHHYIHIKKAENPPTSDRPLPQPSPVATLTTQPVSPKPSPLLPIAPGDPLASTAQTDYKVVVTPSTHQANIYAIHFAQTNSGHVEISKSRGTDGNTSWEYVYSTPLVTHGSGEVAYSLADYDADGTLDLYAIKYAQSTSGFVEISVISGQGDFSQVIGSWRTADHVQVENEVTYLTADYNGDGKFDVYKIQSQYTDQKQTVTIFDGAKDYIESLGTWTSEEETAENADYMMGDYDNDGKFDLFHVAPSTNGQHLAVRVFDASRNFTRDLCAWDVDDTTQ